LDEVRPASFTVEAGEALYLPWGWAHEVESSGDVYMSITYWSDKNE
jgi:mannose-6-phosphate isomerase-like protein (cupin superfamily)